MAAGLGTCIWGSDQGGGLVLSCVEESIERAHAGNHIGVLSQTALRVLEA